MLASLITLLAYSALTLAQLQHWKSDHSSAWSTAESSSSATTFTTAFPASATTSGWTENTHGGNDYTAGLVAALNVNEYVGKIDAERGSKRADLFLPRTA